MAPIALQEIVQPGGSQEAVLWAKIACLTKNKEIEAKHENK